MQRLRHMIGRLGAFFTPLRRSWFELTGPEQKAVLLALFLFLLGLAVKGWRQVF
jgi:hypothetical protein